MRWHLDHAASGDRFRLFPSRKHGYAHIYLSASFP